MRKSLIAATLAIGTLIAPAAQAALVTAWDYTVSSEWDIVGLDAPVFSSGGGSTTTTTSELSWGQSGGSTAVPGGTRSSLVISDSPASSPPLLLTNVGSVATNTFTHNNNVIDANFATLQTAKLDTTLSLTPNTPPGPDPLPGFPQTISFSIRFIETFNGGGCFLGSVSTCDDIFVIELGDLSQQFFYDGFTYQVDIFSTGTLTGLSDAACAAAGAGDGCVGFQTRENLANVEQFRLAISTVPEPGVLALMGLGLLGLAATRRRKLV